MKQTWLIWMALGTALGWAGSVFADDDRYIVERALSSPTINGANVYKQHCVSCHSDVGVINKNTSNKATFKINGYYYKIIAEGKGKMPPWKDVLTKNEIHNVISYIGVIGRDKKRGEAVFKTHCVQCHGTKGRGDGPAAHFYDPRPANLTISDKNDQYKEMIIRMGGEAMGRSKVMPSWESMLSDQEIADVIKYLKSLL